MRRYETTYILRPNLGEEQFTEIIERTNAIITNDGGSIISLNRWGTRKLAYEIRKENLGYYIHFDFAATGSTVQEMERIFRIDDRVLRFLTIKLEDSIDEEGIAKATELAAAAAAAPKDTEVEESEEDLGLDDITLDLDEDKEKVDKGGDDAMDLDLENLDLDLDLDEPSD